MNNPLPWPKRLRIYRERGFDQVGGWVLPAIFDTLSAIYEIQAQLQTKGDVAEIGVYHGRFFLAIDCLRSEDEISVGFDIFDDQYLNIDKSGHGAALSIFLDNIREFSSSPSSVKYKKCDSFSLRSEDILSLSKSKSFRIFSIDGGHTAEHTINDLQLAVNVISPSGVAILDDYYNSQWPGVHEGFTKFMNVMNYRLAPFAFHANKLLLTIITHHEAYFENYRRIMSDIYGYKYKEVKMSGYNVVTILNRNPSQANIIS